MEAGIRPGASWLRKALICALFAYAGIAGASAAAASAAGVVPTDRGPVRGTETSAVKEWLGIPYAAPPVGDLRWAPPQRPARWNGPRDATRFANHCPQPASPFGQASNAEDCLYLNVFAPNNGNGRGHAKNLPVMVWIHGGGLVVGESDDYDPTRLVKQGRIVVTLNYRLGYLGFLAHPALTAEGGGASGNYGLMDQQAALRWVKRNIGKFGGDPGNVTIFGQSAGGLSVHAQLVSPLAAGLFHRAIAQSGAYATSFPSLAKAESGGTALGENLGCSLDQTVACLRRISVENLVAVQPTTAGAILPDVDGRVLPQSVGAAFASGQFNRVPVVEGSTHDEFSIFAFLYVENVFGQLPPQLYGLVINTLLITLGSNANPLAVQALYPVASYGNNVGAAISAIGTDMTFACPARRVARDLSRYVPTRTYEFADRDAPQVFVPPASFDYGAYHASEIPYLFDSTTLGGHAPFTADQEKLAAAMVSYWTRFGATGDPNSGATPQWPAYTIANDTFQSLVPPAPHPAADFAADHKCAFWDALP